MSRVLKFTHVFLPHTLVMRVCPSGFFYLEFKTQQVVLYIHECLVMFLLHLLIERTGFNEFYELSPSNAFGEQCFVLSIASRFRSHMKVMRVFFLRSQVHCACLLHLSFIQNCNPIFFMLNHSTETLLQKTNVNVHRLHLQIRLIVVRTKLLTMILAFEIFKNFLNIDICLTRQLGLDRSYI